ncbi:MAG: hypothetical protein IKN12_06155 [Selenomonadaceae bacterium]|nr:hypothetical protein [Selenomonadaceae bacterium]
MLENQFTLELQPKYLRPIIKLYEIPTLIDTGAVIPVFSFTESDMNDIFNATLIKNDAEITGFGGNDKGSVYSIPDFSIGSITFSPFEVFVPEILRIKYPILLSAPVFYGTDYEFDTRRSLFKVSWGDDYPKNRSFKITKLKGELYPQVNGALLQISDK